MLAVSQVAKTVDGAVHLADVNLEFGKDGFNVLLGPTLAGKTTLMRIMAGLEKPDAGGSIRMNGTDLTAINVRKRSVAMVYQQFVNYQHLSVFDNIASPLFAQNKPAAEIKQTVGETAELLGLTEFLERRPQNLSGGQQQRVALARALVKHADLVLLDEPLANLDYKLREALREELPKIFAQRDCVVVYATTEPEEALLLSGDVTVMHEGRVQQFGPASEVFHNPNHLHSARIFSDPPINELDAVATADTIKLLDVSEDYFALQKSAWQAVPEGKLSLAFRAHSLHLEAPNESAKKITATVQIAEITGSSCYLHVAALNHDWVAQTETIKAWQPGDQVELFLDPNDIMAFASDGQRIQRSHGPN